MKSFQFNFELQYTTVLYFQYIYIQYCINNAGNLYLSSTRCKLRVLKLKSTKLNYTVLAILSQTSHDTLDFVNEKYKFTAK